MLISPLTNDIQGKYAISWTQPYFGQNSRVQKLCDEKICENFLLNNKAYTMSERSLEVAKVVVWVLRPFVKGKFVYISDCQRDFNLKIFARNGVKDIQARIKYAFKYVYRVRKINLKQFH